MENIYRKPTSKQPWQQRLKKCNSLLKVLQLIVESFVSWNWLVCFISKLKKQLNAFLLLKKAQTRFTTHWKTKKNLKVSRKLPWTISSSASKCSFPQQKSSSINAWCLFATPTFAEEFLRDWKGFYEPPNQRCGRVKVSG